ncbi:MAG: hypothetical protein JST09_08940 [Bacteroidetes bacterium]|nr:hypothetical protein [Bacteroidota bacterium]
MEQGFDPEVKKYFRKIIVSFSWGFLWLFINVIAGIYFRLGSISEAPVFVSIIFYSLSFTALVLLIRYYYRIWGKRK